MKEIEASTKKPELDAQLVVPVKTTEVEKLLNLAKEKGIKGPATLARRIIVSYLNAPQEIPEFKTPEEEIEYWEKQFAGSTGIWYEPKPGQKGQSYYRVPLDGIDIERLDTIAQKLGETAGTLAQKVILAFLNAYENVEKNKVLTPPPKASAKGNGSTGKKAKKKVKPD